MSNRDQAVAVDLLLPDGIGCSEAMVVVEIVGERGGVLRQIFSVPEMVDGEPFSVLELAERHAGYLGFMPPQADSLMRSTVA